MNNILYHLLFLIRLRGLSLTLFMLSIISIPSSVWGYTANSLKLEMMEKGGYRVYISYTIPEIREFRDAFVEFNSKKDAEEFYNEILHGADFFLRDPVKKRFSPPPKGPRPW